MFKNNLVIVKVKKLNQIWSIVSKVSRSLLLGKLYFNRFELELKRLEWENYSEHYHNLLWLEENQMETDIAQYAMESVSMRKETKTGLLEVEVSSLF